jgi:hypothetical protein
LSCGPTRACVVSAATTNCSCPASASPAAPASSAQSSCISPHPDVLASVELSLPHARTRTRHAAMVVDRFRGTSEAPTVAVLRVHTHIAARRPQIALCLNRFCQNVASSLIISSISPSIQLGNHPADFVQPTILLFFNYTPRPPFNSATIPQIRDSAQLVHDPFRD